MATRCSKCKHNNPDTVSNCQSCGTQLNQATVAVPTVKQNHEDAHMDKNSQIEDVENQLDQTNMVLEFKEEPEVLSSPIDDDKTHTTTKMPNMDDEDGLLHIGSVRFRGNLVLKDKDRGTIYRIPNENLDEALVGRLNQATGFRPHVDFTDEDGKQRGVSRRHATINQRGDLIFVTDHNSLNGTYLNGQRLVPEQSRVIRDSDSLRIGHISLIVIFEEAVE